MGAKDSRWQGRPPVAPAPAEFLGPVPKAGFLGSQGSKFPNLLTAQFLGTLETPTPLGAFIMLGKHASNPCPHILVL